MSKEIIDAEVREIETNKNFVEISKIEHNKMIADLKEAKSLNEAHKKHIANLNLEIEQQKNGIVFRKLKAEEIESRIARIGEKGKGFYSMWLLYKDARCDMNILDETVGSFNWKREHLRDNANCVVSIWDKTKNQWIHKEDTGAESFTEKEKGLASDSFKRACFNWGIGRELYTAPTIFIDLDADEVFVNKGRPQLKSSVRFRVAEIDYDENGHISYLIIKDNKDNIRFTHGKKEKPATETQIKKITELYEMEDIEKMLGRLGKEALVDLSVEQASTMIAHKSK